MGRSGLLALVFLLFSAIAAVGGQKPIKPAEKDKCPICGMFVAKYPDFAAQVHFKDGSYAVFDGVKDMFKYYANLAKYGPGRKAADITAISVTNYYTLGAIDGYTAYYVAGSDVFGPMGKELVPFDKEADAREFKKDHKGTAILRFKDINAAVIKGLD